MRVQIVEIISRSTQGVTHPFICRCDDDKIYYVKGENAGRRALICEWLAGNIGLALGINLPEIRIIDVPPGLAKYGARDDINELGEIPAFGSLCISQARDLLFADINRINEADKSKILLFDWWIANGDRTLSEHGGNPNLILASNDNRLWVIDHNLAFRQESIEKFWGNHIFATATLKWDNNFKNKMIIRMRSIMQELDSFWEAIPEEWTQYCPDLSLPIIRQILLRMNAADESFWRIP